MENLLQSDRRPGRRDRHHRHHRRADGRHADRAASAEDRRRRPADGRRLHHQRHPPADRADHRASRRRARTSFPRRRWPTPSRCAATHGPHRGAIKRRAARLAATRTGVTAWTEFRSSRSAMRCWSPSRSTCTTGWRPLSRRSDQEDRRGPRARRADRHLGAGDRGQLHRPHARQYRRHVAHARCGDRRGRHAAGRRHHAGRARPVAHRGADRAECRARHGADPAALLETTRRPTMATEAP